MKFPVGSRVNVTQRFSCCEPVPKPLGLGTVTDYYEGRALGEWPYTVRLDAGSSSVFAEDELEEAEE